MTVEFMTLPEALLHLLDDGPATPADLTRRIKKSGHRVDHVEVAATLRELAKERKVYPGEWEGTGCVRPWHKGTHPKLVEPQRRGPQRGGLQRAWWQ